MLNSQEQPPRVCASPSLHALLALLPPTASTRPNVELMNVVVVPAWRPCADND